MCGMSASCPAWFAATGLVKPDSMTHQSALTSHCRIKYGCRMAAWYCMTVDMRRRRVTYAVYTAALLKPEDIPS